jgi:hypothetical protein
MCQWEAKDVGEATDFELSADIIARAQKSLIPNRATP